MEHRAEWRFVLEECGALCVMILGGLLMPKWSADNWDMKQMVQHQDKCVILNTRITDKESV